MSLELDATRTALVVIDLEHGIVARPSAPHAAAEVIRNARRLADALRASGGTVAWVHVLLNEVVQLPADRSRAASGELPPNASEIVPEAGVQAGDLVVAKRSWGAFYGTNLEQALDRKGIETVIMAGIATNMGVECTARAAYDAGYALVFAEDAMSSTAAEMHQFSIEHTFKMMGKVRSTAEVLAAL